jgi:hypothetical protein
VDHFVLLLILNVSIIASTKKTRIFFFFAEELKSYRDFDLHYTSELPLSSFIPIPEDKEVDVIDVSELFF